MIKFIPGIKYVCHKAKFCPKVTPFSISLKQVPKTNAKDSYIWPWNHAGMSRNKNSQKSRETRFVWAWLQWEDLTVKWHDRRRNVISSVFHKQMNKDPLFVFEILQATGGTTSCWQILQYQVCSSGQHQQLYSHLHIGKEKSEGV